MKTYLAIAAALGLVAACDTADATHAVVDNAYPAQTVVYRAWWVATYFPTPVAGGASSEEERSVPVTGTAYAVLAPGWDPASETPPTKLVVVKSKAPFSIDRGDTLHITISDDTFTGNCAANQPLSQADADFIAQSIFPGELANVTYDAATCTTTATDNDAGADADADTTNDAAADANDAG